MFNYVFAKTEPKIYGWHSYNCLHKYIYPHFIYTMSSFKNKLIYWYNIWSVNYTRFNLFYNCFKIAPFLMDFGNYFYDGDYTASCPLSYVYIKCLSIVEFLIFPQP